MPRGWLSPGTGMWIREYLLKVGKGYPYKMWKEYRRWCEEAGYKPPTYENFRRYIYQLKRVGLISIVSSERNGRFLKNYYIVNSVMKSSKLWSNPYKIAKEEFRKSQSL